MTPRTLLAAATLLAVSAVATAETTLTVTLPDGKTKTVKVTDASELSFGGGVVKFAANADATPETFALTDETVITFNGGSGGVTDIATEACTLRLRNNPVGDTLEIIGTTDAPVRLEIYAVGGAMMLQRQQWQGETVDVSALNPGLYILKINNQTIKFLKS